MSAPVAVPSSLGMKPGERAEPSGSASITPRLGQRVSFNFRLIAFAVVMMAVAVGISSWIAYRLKKQSLAESLGRELLAIVKTAAPLIDGDLHERVEGGLGDRKGVSAEFQRLREQLVRVKDGNALLSRGSPLYTMRKPSDFVISGELEFVIMTDANEAGEFFTGARYHVEPHLLQAFAGTAASTGVYTDDEGVWISAAAPIRNQTGEVVAVLQADRPVDFFYAEARSVALKILGGAASSLTIGAALALLFARSLTGPIRHLARATEAVAGGNLDYRVPERRSDELGDLARSFNAMAGELLLGRVREDGQKEALREANRRTEAANRQLAETNRELENALEEAQRLEEESRAADVAKTEFLATMSHEFRTPLNGIFGCAQLIESTELNAEQAECVQTIQRSGERLLSALSAVLEYSQLDRGKRPREWGNVNLRPLINSVAAVHRGAAISKGLEFVVSVDPELPTAIRADGPALQRVLDVLLSNAVKFTVKGSVTVSVGAERNRRPSSGVTGVLAGEIDSDLRVVVADTGSGIPPVARARLFLPFVQGDSSMARANEGLGLGLAIAYKLARTAGGDLTVRSEFEIGSSFELVLPARC